MAPMNNRLMRPRAKGGVSPGFDFSTVSGLVLWLDGSDTSKMSQNSDGTVSVSAAGDPVGRLSNKAGTSFNALQTTNNLRPTLLLSAVNKRNALSVSSTAASGFSTLGKPSLTTANTYFFVGQYTGPNNSWLALHNASAFLDAADGTSGTPDNNSGTPTFRVNRVAVSRSRVAIRTAVAGGLYVLSVNSVNFSGWSSADFQAMNFSTVAYNFIGTFCEMLIYNVALSASDVATVEDGLCSKWGIP